VAGGVGGFVVLGAGGFVVLGVAAPVLGAG